jgi:hypothetical protein
LTRATVGVETTIAGDVCLDDEKHGHGHHETALDASPGGERSVLPTRIDLRIAIKSPTSYSDAKNRCSSGDCRLVLRPNSPWKAPRATIIATMSEPFGESRKTLLRRHIRRSTCVLPHGWR